VSARALLGLASVALGACASFEDPTIVRDLRVLAMRAEPPEQVVSVDPPQPVPGVPLDQLRTTEISALIADPGARRPLRWSMTACLLDDNDRCDLARPHIDLGSSVIDDPEEALVPQAPIALIAPDDPLTRTTLAAMFLQALEANPVQALGGIEYAVELRVGDVAGLPADDVVAIKRLRVAPRLPQARTPNANPYIEYMDGAQGLVKVTVPTGQRCASAVDELLPQVASGGELTLYPVEPTAAREVYEAVTLDGQTVMLTETIEYQWLSAYGTFSDDYTGGGRDLLGNQSLLGSDWRAPRGVGAPLRVSVWMIQRDERFGVTWFETCILVRP